MRYKRYTKLIIAKECVHNVNEVPQKQWI